MNINPDLIAKRARSLRAYQGTDLIEYAAEAIEWQHQSANEYKEMLFDCMRENRALQAENRKLQNDLSITLMQKELDRAIIDEGKLKPGTLIHFNTMDENKLINSVGVIEGWDEKGKYYYVAILVFKSAHAQTHYWALFPNNIIAVIGD